MRRGVTALFTLFVLAVSSIAAAAEIYPMVFPVDGDNHYSDTFGAPRGGGRTHEGIDIMADKMTPVVAVASGTVGWMHNEQGGNCCAMELVHDDGYRSWYIHLNNDTPGTDDGQGWGFAPGIEPGVHVQAGQLIGYVGDSGNAEASSPHLHFELHDPTNTPFNPYESLLAATADGDEMFFYALDGTFAYHDIGPTGELSPAINSGTGYSTGWDSIISIDLDGDGQDEMFFYRTSGSFRYYDVNPDGSLGAPIRSGEGYSTGWDSITAVDLDGDGQDEVLFYRTSGSFRYYDIGADGRLGGPINAGTGYSTGWDSITAVDLDGDGQDEMFFYKTDGTFAYYDISSDGTLAAPVNSGTGYSSGWDPITAVDLDGDGQDEMFFYRTSGSFRYYDINPDGSIGAPIRTGSDYPANWSSITAVDLD